MAMTVIEAREKNAEGIATGGCWRCIQNQGPKGKTQWETKELKFKGHRSFCKKHYWEEVRGERDF